MGGQLVDPESQVCVSWQGYKERRAANSSKSLGSAAACLALGTVAGPTWGADGHSPRLGAGKHRKVLVLCGGPAPPRRPAAGRARTRPRAIEESLRSLHFAIAQCLRQGTAGFPVHKVAFGGRNCFPPLIRGRCPSRKSVKNSLNWTVKSTGRNTQGKKNGSRPRGKNKCRSFSRAARSSCKQTHHNKPSLICFGPTVNRFCGFCRIEYLLRAEASVADLVAVNYGSLIPEDRKQRPGHKSERRLSPPVRRGGLFSAC